MHLVLLGSQHVFYYSQCVFVPTLGGEMAKKKAGLKSRLKSYQRPFLTVYIFSDTTDNLLVIPWFLAYFKI
jgi:hypothetical protein